MKLSSPTWQLIFRGSDPTGNGWFGASRGTRTHKGVDIVVAPGEEIFAMISGKVTKLGYVYSNPKEAKPTMRFVEIESKIEGDHYRLWQMYVSPTVEKGDQVEQNQIIGKAQDIADYHNSDKMKNHVHVQLWRNGVLIDPEPMIKKMV